MLALVATLVLAQVPAPVLFLPVRATGLPASSMVAVEKGLAYAFSGGDWDLDRSAERSAEAAAAQDGGAHMRAAKAALSCSAVSLRAHVRLDCAVVRLADQRIVGSDRVACGGDLEACARAVGELALKRLEGASPPLR